MTKTISSIYDTLSAMSTFIKTLTAWFGFGPIVVLVFILFFVKLFQSILGAGRVFSFFLSFLSVTALWLTWNISYYEEYRFLEIGRVYGFILLHLAAVYLIYIFFSWATKSTWRAMRNKGVKPYSIIELYERIDEGILVAKRHLRNKDRASALREIRKISGFLEKIPDDALTQNPEPALKITQETSREKTPEKPPEPNDENLSP